MGHMRRSMLTLFVITLMLTSLGSTKLYAGAVTLVDVASDGVSGGSGGSPLQTQDFNLDSYQSGAANGTPYDNNLFSTTYGQPIRRPVDNSGRRPGVYVLIGDRLWYVAAILMRDPYGWRVLYSANQQNMQNPNNLQPGSTLQFPDVADMPIHSLIGQQALQPGNVTLADLYNTGPNSRQTTRGTYNPGSQSYSSQQQRSYTPAPNLSVVADPRDRRTTSGFTWAAPINSGSNPTYLSPQTYTQQQQTRPQQQQAQAGAFNAYMPITTGRVTSDFGRRSVPNGLSRRAGQTHETHAGIDIGAPRGTKLHSTGAGVVEFAGWQNGYGNVVKVRHPNGAVTMYAHCQTINVRRGQQVAGGQQVATVNSTGRSTGDHVHFEVRVNGRAVNPRDYFRFPSKGARL